ncbi:MAG: ParB/RepB/Spo0J family partition protein [bacterium]
MKLENIPLAQIDRASAAWDRYVFTFPLEPGPVLESIQSVGLQQPVVVAAERENYAIVIGVRRLLACQQLAWQDIPAIVVREETPENLLWLSLQEKRGGRALNAMEKSRVLQRFAGVWEGDLERLQKEICPLLDIPPTNAAVESYLFLKQVPDHLQSDVAGGRLTPQHTDLLRPLRPEDRRVAVDRLFTEHRVTLQEAREILENASSLAARENRRVRDIFDRPEVKDIFAREPYTPRQRTTMLRTWLHQQRYPQLSALEQKFDKLAQTLAADQPIAVKPPRDFEGQEITVSFRAQQPKEIQDIVATLKEADKRGLWKKLFALLQGELHDEENSF